MSLNARLRPGRAWSALALSGSIALVGYRRQALTRSGAAGALLVGSSTYLAGGWRWSSVLLTFFASSSALSRLERLSSRGREIAAMTERGAQRDLVQALANGGVATFAALGYLAVPAPILAGAFAGAFAAANADTWATEIGGLSARPPRSIIGGAPVPAGTSGGVTPHGLAGALGGGVLIGIAAGLVQATPSNPRYGAVVALSGIFGSLLDSVAGATIQAAYRCPHCDKPTERRVHGCGTPTELVRGRAWCTNDVVNVICTLGGAVAACCLTRSITLQAGTLSAPSPEPNPTSSRRGDELGSMARLRAT